MVDIKKQIVDSISPDQYHALLDISHTVNSSLDIQEILDLVLSELATVVEANASSIWLLDDEKQRLNVAAATGEKSEEIKEVVLNYTRCSEREEARYLHRREAGFCCDNDDVCADYDTRSGHWCDSIVEQS